jgi:ABC-type Fe3+ transport system permease subunit
VTTSGRNRFRARVPGARASFVCVSLLVVAPLALPLLELARQPAGFRALLEVDRQVVLLGNTFALALGAVLLAVPAGTVAALVLERGRVPGAGFLRALVVAGVFVPLPVYAAAWQAVFGGGLLPDVGGWRPWRQGLLPAVWVHAAAGLPWVIGFVALALRTSDRRLEDDALLAGGSGAVLRWVLLPRVKLAAGAGAAWVAVQAFAEVAVTDVMMVRTFAEEVYFQLVGNPDGVPAAVAVTLPLWAFAACVGVWVFRRAARVPVRAVGNEPPRPLDLRRGSGVVLWFGVVLFVAVPLLALVQRVGSVEHFVRTSRAHGGTLADSLLWGAVAGVVAAALAVWMCWRGSRWVPVVAVVAWVTPAPLVGLGLKQAIDLLLSAEDAVLAALGLTPTFPPLRSALYDQPSPLPGIWASVVRFFPVAVAVVWPVARRIPRELMDSAALDGGRRAQWLGVFWPAVKPAAARAAVVVAVLSLGEIVAGKLVQPPGRSSFVGELFDAMHYGADATVAAMCVLQLVVIAAACGILRGGARIG